MQVSPVSSQEPFMVTEGRCRCSGALLSSLSPPGSGPHPCTPAPCALPLQGGILSLVGSHRKDDHQPAPLPGASAGPATTEDEGRLPEAAGISLLPGFQTRNVPDVPPGAPALTRNGPQSATHVGLKAHPPARTQAGPLPAAPPGEEPPAGPARWGERQPFSVCRACGPAGGTATCSSREHLASAICEHDKFICIKTEIKVQLGFPGGAVVGNPPANAGDTGSSPGLGRSHMPRSNEVRAPQLLSLHSRARVPQLLSPRATTTEARAPRARAPQQEKPPQREACAPQQRVAPARCN
ncbi:hypothetical protein J1605_022231 [Eschrichtius robustus]|uniref:Uncharacterized protein n=1 Tax=Eschrichtius robustus TaxID=9764 RepID=A0AB34HDQ1_ESCRO|nr:hypothetical protein J1605_022231 [Eschrichtius robustus]